MQRHRSIALVLSGGGARGAYEVGVVAGITEVLGLGRKGPGPFEIFTGTSVGAINAAFFAAHSDRGDMGVQGLIRQWAQLRLGHHIRPDLLGFLGVPRARWPFSKAEQEEAPSYFGRALLDPKPLEALVNGAVPFDRLRDNMRNKAVKSLIVSALRITDGVHTAFVEMSPDGEYRPPVDPKRLTKIGPIDANHILASAAIPLIFPARHIDNNYYYDGGLRSNTPIAPAIRAGAERLVVISLLHRAPRDKVAETVAPPTTYPNTLFLLGKVLDALLLDPVDYDLQVLQRLNNLLDVLEQTLPPSASEQVTRVLESDRGMKYRQVRTLIFRPSEDIGVLAGEYMRSNQDQWRREDRTVAWVMSRAAAFGRSVEADLGAFLLFDGGFARRLIELGKRDAIARATEIEAFFRPETLRPRAL